MTRFLAIAAAVIGFSAAAAPDADAQRRGGGNEPGAIYLYEHASFQGRSVRIDSEVTDLRQLNFNDMASSFRIEGGGQWELCWNANYRGSCQVVSGQNPDLGRSPFNDQISSVRPVGHAGPPGDRVGLTLWSEPNFRGRSVTISEDVANLERVRFNDQARSVQVHRGSWTLCEHSDYRGRCETFDRDVGDLQRFSLSRNISSVASEGRAPGRPGGPGGPGGGWGGRVDGGTQGAASIFYARPTISGQRVSSCVSSSRNCGQAAADQLCRDARYSRAVHFITERHGGQAWHMGDRRAFPAREVLADVLCVR
jgi:hypothetical protein